MPKFTPNDNGNKSEKPITINLETILLQLLKNWWVLLIGTLIAGMAIYFFVTETYKEQYASTATFVVTGKGSVSGTKLSDIDTTKSMTEAFAYVLDSDILMEKVKESVGISTFKGKVTTGQLEDTNILTLTVTSDSPKLSFDVINAIIDNHHIVTDSMMQNATMYVLMQPTMAKSPVVPLNRRTQVYTYSAAAFLLIAAAIVIKTIFSKKIYTEKDFEDKVGEMEKLATLERENKRRNSRRSIFTKKEGRHVENLLVSNPTTSFGYTETFRLLQTRVQNLMRANGYKSLMVSSVDADEGRSTVAVNLALTFARDNNRVLLVEGDLGEPSLAKLLGKTDDDISVSIDEYILGGRNTEKLPSFDSSNKLDLLICRSSVPDHEKLLNSNEMMTFATDAKRYYDYIIVDTPPVASSNDAEYLSEMCDAAIMVVRQGFATAPRITTALETLNNNTDVLGYVLNDVTYLPIFGGGTQNETYAKNTAYGKRTYGAYGRYGAYGSYGAYGGAAAEYIPAYNRADTADRSADEQGARSSELTAHSSYRSTPDTGSDEDGDTVIDLGSFLRGTLSALLRIIWLPIALAVLLSLLLCYRAKVTYQPKYRASATFTIGVVGSSGDAVQDYSKSVAKKLSNVFPHILTSGILNNLVREDINTRRAEEGLTPLKKLPATLAAHVEGETTLFTLEATSSKPENAYEVLQSAIRKYPQVTNFVIGNTTMMLLREPSMPTRPVNSPNYKQQILIGCGAALLLSLITAAILHLTRKTVGGTEEIRKILNIRCIGTVPFDKTGKDEKRSTLVNILDNNISKDFSDSINLIRRRLQKTCEENGEKVLLFAGSVPGEGKSTIALNTAMALSAAGKTVVFIDCDIRKPSSIGTMEGVREAGLVEYLMGEASAEEIVASVSELAAAALLRPDEGARRYDEAYRGLCDNRYAAERDPCRRADRRRVC